MAHKVYPAAARAIKEIWRYTDRQWGAQQADAYVMGLHEALDKAAGNRMVWRMSAHPAIHGIYFVRYQQHVLFFRDLGGGTLGLVSVLDGRMDLPRRLQDDLDTDPPPV